METRNGMKAMVLAAGVGSRLDPLTRQFPKPLVPFVNRPVMEHLLRLLQRHGITETVSNLHYLPDLVPAYFGNGAQLGLKMNFLREKELTGDAGGVRACREYFIDDTFLVVMGDLITDMDIAYVIRQHKDKGALATIALKQVEDVERFGVALVDTGSFITAFQEKPARNQARSNLASTGVYVFEPEIFNFMPRFGELGFGKQLFPWLVEKGQRVLGVEVWGYWSDVGTIEQYRRSTIDALEGLIDLNLPGDPFEFGWRAQSSTLSSSAILDGVLLLGENSHVGSNVRIKGSVVIGDNCLIEDGVELVDSVIWSNSIIGAHASIRNSVIGSGCHIEERQTLFEDASVSPPVLLDSEQLQSMIESRRLAEKSRSLEPSSDNTPFSNYLADLLESRELDEV